MFIYLFPIFCFGLVMCGIVLLGLMEAARQVKADSLKEREPATRDDSLETDSSPNGRRKCQSPLFAARSMYE
jgi:hypothetical protein